MDNRLLSEIEHGEKIVEQAGLVWSWETPAGKKRWQRRVDILTSSLQGKTTSKVLELGCGTGYFTRELLKTGVQVTAIDISPHLIEKAKKDNPKATFILGDAHHSGLESNSFDTILGSSVLHHLEINSALKEIFRLLKPGGEVIFTEPNMLNPQIAIQKNIPWIKEKMGDSPHETAFFRWSLKKNMEKHNFKQIEIVPFDFLHPSIPKGLISTIDPFCMSLEKILIVQEFAGSLFIRARK
ncbi:MAG: class I SAM-dependent methyltransferase [Bacteriovoracaceae bacterium]